MGLALLLFCMALPGCAREEEERPGKIEIHFFYNEPCASCDGTKD